MKLQAECATETHIDPDGYYIIEQAEPDGEGGVVALSRNQAELIVSELTELLKMPKWGMSGGE